MNGSLPSMIHPEYLQPTVRSIPSRCLHICWSTGPVAPFLGKTLSPSRIIPREGWIVLLKLAGKLQEQDLNECWCTKEWSFKLRNYKCERLMFDFHFREQGSNFWYKFKIILEHFCLKHGIKIFRYLISFLNKINFTWKQLLRLSAISAISGTWT